MASESKTIVLASTWLPMSEMPVLVRHPNRMERPGLRWATPRRAHVHGDGPNPEAVAEEVRFPTETEDGEVRGILHRPAAKPAAGLIVAHGRSNDMKNPLVRRIAEAGAEHGLLAVRINFRYVDSNSSASRDLSREEDDLLGAVRSLRKEMPTGPIFVAGKSMGARVCARASHDPDVAGLIALGYPLHPMFKPNVRNPPASYKPSALNPPYLCNEALRLINDIEEGTLDQLNLVHVLDELVWAIKDDRVSKSLLDVDLDQYVLRNEETPIGQKKIRLEVLSRTLEPHRYLDHCCALLKRAVIDKSKGDIDSLARTLITTLVNMGVSKAFLYQKTKDYFFLGDVPQLASPNELDGFIEAISPVTHNFDVFFIVSEHVRQVAQSIKPFRIEIVEKLPEELSSFAEAKGFVPTGTEVLIKIDEIKARDCYSAREEAERRIDTLKDLFTLFFHRNELRWRDATLISQCCIDAPAIVYTPKSSMDKAFDMTPAYAARQLNWVIKNLALRFGGSFRRFNRIVDLHGICVTNEIPENQLLNLWISLETLVPSTAGKNKINNVAVSLDPFVRMTYVRRLLDRAVFDLMLWNPFVVKGILKRVPAGKGLKLPLKLLLLLSLAENEPLRSDLYGRLKDFHLLRFRLFRLSQTLRSPESVKEMLNTHSRKVAWQLRRLYRTRNLLVHSGRTPSYLGTLIENGHDYLDMVLNEIMQHSCGTYRIETIEQTFELQKILLQRFESSFPNEKEFTRANVTFLYAE